MKRASRTDPVAGFVALLEELQANPPGPGCDALARLVARIRPRRREDAEAAATRFRSLAQLLAARPDLAAALRSHLVAQLTSRMHRILYADSGMLTDQGFRAGLARRVLGRLLPPATDTDYLRSLIAEVFDRPDDHRWLAALPRADWDALLDALDVRGEGFASARRKCRHELLEALRLASTRLAAAGTDPALLQYLPALARHESPFLAQADEMRSFIAGQAGDEPLEDDGHLEVLLEQCDEYVARVRHRSQEAGVGVNLVFLLARIEQIIARVRLLHGLATPNGEPAPRATEDSSGDATAVPVEDPHGRVIDFFVRLVRQENRRNSIRDLFRGTTELIARRVTEQASRSGEHYISHTRSEFTAIYRAAAGAGLIIACMALLKILTSKLDLPLWWEGTAYALNYGIGFVIIHLLHLTIATKQPAMTAATLAASLDGRDDRETRLDALVELASEVSRTQWISIAGNVSIAMLTAFAIAMVAGRFLGWEPIDAAKAAHLLHDLHPLRSAALLYAAIAGVFLFLSGLISGYYDNLSLYHRVPQRLRRVKWLRRLLGPARLERLAVYVEHNLGALAGNFLFGCMLGYTPMVGQLLGLPLDIRHVAFASANFAYGLDGLEFAVSHHVMLVSFAGVLLIGFVNLLVSFSLALKVALRSRGITREQTEGLWGRVIRRFLDRPRDFFWPPAGAGVAGPEAAR
jgi:site-specific recombinase